MDDEIQARAAAFGDVAEVYERSRPTYPDEAVRWMVGAVPSDVADVGAGTGKLTRVLTRLGHRVTAVDPMPRMLEQLRRAVPGVTTLVGSAEELPLTDQSVDAVTFAQSWHWVDVPRAAREVARVLRPGGRVTMVWNMRDDTRGGAAELSALIGAEDAHPVREHESDEPELPDFFGPVEGTLFRHEQQLDRKALVDLVASRSYVAIQPEPDRERLLAEVAALHDRGSQDGLFAVPYVTHCFRAVRL